MVFNPGLADSQILANSEICNIFGCSPQGGMRRSKATNTLILISDYSNPEVPYHDRWIGPILHYTGMGRIGDQTLTNQNKTLAESGQNPDLGIFFFEVFEPRRYTYRGQVLSAGKPYQESQEDQEGAIRQVWIFPLKLGNSDIPGPIPKEIIDKLETKKGQSVHKIPIDDLKKRALESKAIPGERLISSKHFERNPYVAEFAKRRANGICQLCKSPAPFATKQGLPYLETHHIVPLALEGNDTIENTVALCPNCHRKIHVLNISDDVNHLLEMAKLE